MRSLRRSGFSLLEVVFAVALMGIALFVLLRVLVAGLVAQDKTSSFTAAHAVANRLLEREVRDLESRPPDDNSPRTYEEKVGHTHFLCEVTSWDVANQVTGKPFGTANGADDNRLKMLQVRVRWGSDEVKTGAGKQEILVSRLANRRPR